MTPPLGKGLVRHAPVGNFRPAMKVWLKFNELQPIQQVIIQMI